MSQNNDLQKLRHSAAHLLAHAVLELFPDTILTIGPATKEGFFYDFLPTTNFKEEDLTKLEARMHEIAKRNLPITHEQMPKDQARALFKHNKFKLELIDSIPDDTVGIARQGDFVDLCKGGHVAATGDIKHFKLLSISGAYWRADRNNQALQRIAGTAFPSAKELRLFEQRREEAAKYDHRKLGKELDLFSFHEEGVGFPFFHPHGKTVLNTMQHYLRNKLEEAGYQEVATPMMLSDELWRASGHYAHYKDNMYFCDVEDKVYAVKPMNCPGAILIYKERPRSYRDLPLRLAEFGLVHRFELSGVLHGLFRARAFMIDDGHIFCTPDQIEQELVSAIQMVKEVLNKFGFTNITVGLSTKPNNAMGSDDLWDRAINALKNSLEKAGLAYNIQEGEGAFYGPKIEFLIEDSMGRTWQCSTVQLDFFLPENFDLTYTTPQGTKARPVMIHRAIYGSFERFFGILLEHYKGKLPFWVAPVQVTILTITDEQKAYARSILEQLKAHGIRAEIDETSDQISGKIKRAQLAKIPWMLVVGQKEVENNTITLRHTDGKQEFGLTLDEVLQKATQEVA
ncbi:MAG TPA: threonine--tRNA ligase [Candidatus Dependentiae bacterium]|nr:threonine--tRNA ligase [Candidatus Dependentiae bacterium]HRQ62585.1 threonine--tRNA ligase [Candidatus Dependentiae bacterium]